MSRNVEIKAVLRDRDAIIAAAAMRSDSVPEMISQHDFFFRCGAGRLKLRVFGPDCGELIQYEREDMAGPCCSRYQIAYTSTPEILLDILSRTLGRTGEVKKTRILFLIGRQRSTSTPWKVWVIFWNSKLFFVPTKQRAMDGKSQKGF